MNLQEMQRSLVIVLDGVPKNGNAKDGQKMLAKWGVAAEDVLKVKKVFGEKKKEKKKKKVIVLLIFWISLFFFFFFFFQRFIARPACR